MHTFFINTSEHVFGNYAEIFEIQHETRRLIPLACPLADWEDRETGFEACVRRMGEMIDSYKDINNEFNLILYIDLLSFREYADIPKDEDKARDACLVALKTLLRHYIWETLLNTLEACGRKPRQTLLIFEQNEPPQDKGAPEQTQEYCQRLLGLPSKEEIYEIVRKLQAGEETLTPALFVQKVQETTSAPIGARLLACYTKAIGVFLENMQSKQSSKDPLGVMLRQVLTNEYQDEQKEADAVATVDFITNRRAGATNKQEQARRDLQLSFYLMDCVREKSVYQEGKANQTAKKVKQFPDMNWDKVGAALAEKGRIFRRLHLQVRDRKGEEADGKLAPVMHEPNYAWFGLNEEGKRGVDWLVEDDQREDQDAHITAGKKSTARKRSLKEHLSIDLLPEQTKKNITGEAPASKGTINAEYYKKKALQLRAGHVDYLSKLKIKVTEALSDYAGRGWDDRAAKLPKRRVLAEDVEYLVEADKDCSRPYTDISQRDVSRRDTRSADVMREVAQEAYASVLLSYTEFCAGRSVAVTDIEQQCNRFITTVYQIEASLKKLMGIAVGLMMAVFVLYIPYLVLQWPAISTNMLSGIIAGISVGIPLVVAGMVFGAVAAAQRKKYSQAWNTFRDQSDEAKKENEAAALKFQQLLTAYIPALRYIYEYKLDVDFYNECWRLAQAKIAHHENKLRTRAEAVGNIVEDLELDEMETDGNSRDGRDEKPTINYHLPFCVGKENRDFYEILDSKVMEAVYGKK